MTPAPASTDARTGSASLAEEKGTAPGRVGAEEIAGMFPGLSPETRAKLATIAARLPVVSEGGSPKGSPVPQGRGPSAPSPRPVAETPEAARVGRIARAIGELGPHSPAGEPERLGRELIEAVGDPNPARALVYWPDTLRHAANGVVSAVELAGAILSAAIKGGRLDNGRCPRTGKQRCPAAGISAAFRRAREAKNLPAPSY